MYDVIIVGAGPSGLNAARILSNSGLRVVVLEKKQAIGDHVICTGIVSEEAFIEFGLSRDSILTNIKKVRWNSPHGNALDYVHPFPFAHVVDRKKFDKNLSEKICQETAEIELGCEVVDISVSDKKADVYVKKEGRILEQYSSQVVLIATGIDYNLHKKLGLGFPRDFLNGVQAELKLDNIDYANVFIGNEIAPGAFAWLVPLGNSHVRVGLMSEKDPMGCFQRLMSRCCHERAERFEKNRIQVKVIAQGLVTGTYGNRLLTMGEAAGQVKTTTGGGIYYGLLCSKIASDVVKDRFRENDFSANALSVYEEMWKKAIQKEILIGYYVRKFCAKFNDIQIEKMFEKAQTNGIIPLIKERGNFDWHSDLIISLMKRIPFWQIIKTKFFNVHGV